MPGPPRCATLEVAPLGDAQGAACGQAIVGTGRLPVTGHVEQVRPDGVDAVVPGERGIGLRRGKLLKADPRAVDHGNGDDAVEGDHRPRRDAVQ